MNRSVLPRRTALALAVTSLLLTLPAMAAESNAVPADAMAQSPDAASAPVDALAGAGDAASAGAVDRLQGIEVTSSVGSDGAVLYLDEKRHSSVITEGLGAEQIARTGDSDVATTLKRVTGLSVIDGKYVYVRGLGDRYSSVLLNGASIPSPDYTRRVVPLDLFPNELLSGIVVQKSYSPDMPGDFGGGTVQLRTRDVPTKFFFRMQGQLGYVDGTTGKDGDRYDGGARDWTGYDDGSRELPESLAAATAGGSYLRPRTTLNPGGATPEQLQTYGRDLAAGGYGLKEQRIGPDTGYAMSVGNGWKIGEDVRFGVIAALRYSQKWDLNREQRRTYATGSAGLNEVGNLAIDDTERSIDASGFVGLGLDIGMNHRIGLTSLLLRQTDDRSRISEGTQDSVSSRFHELKWVENQLRANQLNGHHVFPAAHELEVDWQYTKATASRDQPNTRSYRYDYFGADTLEFSAQADGNAQTFGQLQDDQTDAALKAMLPFNFGEASRLAVSAGAGRKDRDRESALRRYTFGFAPGSPLLGQPGFLEQPIDLILAPGNIGPTGLVLRETTRATDNYNAQQRLDAGFVNADLDIEGKYRFAVGARRERNDQQVTTFSLSNPSAPPVISRDQSSIWLPAAALTWVYSESAQLRAGFSRTVSRPDFRELSAAPFTDPELDIETIGNPDLRTTRIRNLDLRWEYYYSDVDSLSVSLFKKEFTDPIEKLRLAGSTPLLGLANAKNASNEGIEFDISRNLGFFNDNGWLTTDLTAFNVGFNYARIRSEIELDPASASYQTNASRPMQGQSPYVANLQLGYTDADGGREATLLFNRSGRRISEVGVAGQPDIYEESFNALDFSYKQRLGDDWRFGLRLRNLLDPAVNYTQGGLDTRRYRKGRELAVNVEWRPQPAR